MVKNNHFDEAMNFNFKRGYYGFELGMQAICDNCNENFHVNRNGDIKLNGEVITKCPYCKENEMRDKFIKVTQNLSVVVMDFLKSNGYNYKGIGSNSENSEKGYIAFNLHSKVCVRDSNPANHHCVSFEEMVELVSETIVKIGDDVVEFLSNGDIKVGCSTISKENIATIYELSQENDIINF